MIVGLAQSLDDLHKKYAPELILAKVRKFYELEDGIPGISDAALFLHAIRDYRRTSKGCEREAQAAYLDYCVTHRVPLEVARCLLPGKLEKPRVSI